MSKPHSHSTDLQGLSRMTIDAIVGIVGIVEETHLNILKSTGKLGAPIHGPLSGATSLVYRGIRGVARLTGTGLDALLAQLTPLLGNSSTWAGRNAVLSALNGVLGDYLAASGNPLAIGMQLRRNGKPLELNKSALAHALPKASGRILILVHGLCMNDLQWRRRGHDHGATLAAKRGYTPVYLHYNTGLHISSNGREWAEQLESLVREWPVPVEEVVFLCHSMGGLVTRSAWHYGDAADHRWCRLTSKMVFLGTPHHGAPLERGGNWFHVITDISPYTAPFSRLGKIRSAGITDLRYGNLLEADWQGRERFAQDGDCRHPMPLPRGVQCFAIAATTGKQAGDLSDRLLGDGLVPLASALGMHEHPNLNLNFASDNQWIACKTNHLGLLYRNEVTKQLLSWL